MEAKNVLFHVYSKWRLGPTVGRLLLAVWLAAVVAVPLSAQSSAASDRSGLYTVAPRELTDPPTFI